MSAPGNSARPLRQRAQRAFTLIEVMVVLAVIAVSVAVVTLALRDSTADQLDREAARLSALLETARAEARASGLLVRWAPARDNPVDHFRFDGLPKKDHLPTRWLDERVVAEVIGATAVALGPEPILPAQRIRLRLQDVWLDVATDGLGPFGAAAPASAPVQ